MRDHDVTSHTAGELQRTRRDLAASLALARPDSPIRAPIEAWMSDIDAWLAGPPAPEEPPAGQAGRG